MESQVLKLHERYSQPIGTAGRVRVQNEIQQAESRISSLENDLKEIQQRMDQRQQEQGYNEEQPGGTLRMPNETRRDYLIRTGKITPFSAMGNGPAQDPFASLQDALIDAEEERDENEAIELSKGQPVVSHRNLQRPGFEFGEGFVPDRPKKRRRVEQEQHKGANKEVVSDDSASYVASSDEAHPEEEEEEEEFASDEMPTTKSRFKTKRTAGKRKQTVVTDETEDFTGVDDGNERLYQSRLEHWVNRRKAAREREQQRINTGPHDEDGDGNGDDNEPEWFKPHPTVADTPYTSGYRIPGDIYPYLFDYQKTGVQWLWELHQQQVGGIIGDEMGLGKTIQVIAFLAGLHYSKKLTKPVIVICPATVMRQWVNEFHRWWSPFRVSILHTSGSGMVNIRSESSREDAMLKRMWDSRASSNVNTAGYKAASKIVRRVKEEGHVLVTTYSGLQTYAPLLIPTNWSYAILDEGHKIRNPNTAITMFCKELRTPHRIILSGTPMQNNLTELWSLFDFIFPMRLGTLVNFRNQFEFPIRQGGYANASNLQIQTAARCAETLKDAISPYLLQRFKVDVAADLPKKSEQVLFCKLTKPQRAAYEAFLASDEMKSILNGRRQVLYGVDILRKICNHPDLQMHKLSAHNPNYGNATKSGKMQVVKALLELWRDTDHKTLLFTQHRIMLDIMEKFVKSLAGVNYRRMDGSTPIHQRQGMVDEFNRDPSVHVFLLTTKVGGLGVNLTGADRVIIYDPDWNPSTDVQARERAWRLGQNREVMVYRLMTAGTIEEKIYHRQIFKQFLTNKIMKDPKQRQTFQMSDLHDLFSLGDEKQGPTETSQLFHDAQVTYEEAADINDKDKNEGPVVGQVAGVASVENFQGDVENAVAGANPETPKSEARIMQGIFARSGVQSALEHEQIVNNGKRSVRADPRIIEAEAKKVAAEAAEELRKTGEAARHVPIGTPTWTGQFGVSGKPPDEEQRRGQGQSAFGIGLALGGASSSSSRRATGPSSASILANLSNRDDANTNRLSSSTNPGTNPSQKDFLAMIRDYIIAHGGSVYTQMLIAHFNRFCTTPQRSAEFKEMLKMIAVLEKGGRNGRGKWSLKPEYAKKR